MVYYKETAKCQHLIFWPGSQTQDHYHSEKLEPNQRPTTDRVPLQETYSQQNITTDDKMTVNPLNSAVWNAHSFALYQVCHLPTILVQLQLWTPCPAGLAARQCRNIKKRNGNKAPSGPSQQGPISLSI
jgi:hypothetical protein